MNELNRIPLKITVDRAENRLTLRLEGKISGPMVEELRRAWSAVAPEIGNRGLVVDLRDALYVDKAGLALLSDIHHATAAEFQADSPLTRYFAEQASGNSNLNGLSKGT